MLEPSFGEGAFLIPIIEYFMAREEGTASLRLGKVLTDRLWGVEIDAAMYERALARIESTWGALPAEHNLRHGDYFEFEPGVHGFDLIVGNPPFGGTFDRHLEDRLDRRYGSYGGSKLKKETYAFFIAKALEELAHGGELAFICSDTFLTIKTMAGLRKLLIDHGEPTVTRLAEFSDETSYDMVTLTLRSGAPATAATVFGSRVRRNAMEATGNYSWTINEEYAELFAGPKVGDFMVATGGMTIGRNELFVREIKEGVIEEPYEFVFGERPITLQNEFKLARLGKLSERRQREIRAQQVKGRTERVVHTRPLDQGLIVPLPHPNYRYYNKAQGERLYAPPAHVVYWKDDGDAVLTFKKSGPWYLRGVGGGPYFFREGLTWQLVAPRINARFLPAGYVLDSGAPCAFLRPEVDHDELWVILGWLQTRLASAILKDVLNHTRNIQGKDIERLPYPWWATRESRRRAAAITRDAVCRLRAEDSVDREEIAAELDLLLGTRGTQLPQAAQDRNGGREAYGSQPSDDRSDSAAGDVDPRPALASL